MSKQLTDIADSAKQISSQCAQMDGDLLGLLDRIKRGHDVSADFIRLGSRAHEASAAADQTLSLTQARFAAMSAPAPTNGAVTRG